MQHRDARGRPRLMALAVLAAIGLLASAAGALADAGRFVIATTYQIDRLYPHPQTGGHPAL